MAGTTGGDVAWPVGFVAGAEDRAALIVLLHLASLTPRRLMELTTEGGDRAKRAFDAMMTMRKIDIAKLDAAVEGVTADA